VTENDTRGDIVVYLQKPSDFSTLISTDKKVEKIVIYEQEVDFSGSVVVNIGVSVDITINLTYDSSDNVLSSGQFSVLSSPETIDGNVYNYRYTITGNSERLGKQFRYKVLASNENGDSPLSLVSSSVWSFIKPELQDFTLDHNNETSSASGAELVLYDGKMSAKIQSLSSINGGKDYLTLKTNVGTAKIYDVELKLTIKNASNNNVEFDEFVRFEQDVDEESSGNWVGRGTYTYDFDSLTSATYGNQKLNDMLDLGTKYIFSLVRVSKDHANTSETYSSNTYDITRTKFASPSKVTFIECYAVNDDLTPTSDLTGEKYLRLIFEQLEDSDFNGMQAFKDDVNAHTVYSAYRNSQEVPGLAGVEHDYSDLNKTKEILVPSGSISFSSVTLYARAKSFNIELNIYIDHNESSPQVTEITFGKTGPVTNVNIVVTHDGATITYTNQGFNALRGSAAAAIQNRLILFKDGQAAPVSYTNTNLGNQPNPSFTVTGLTTGATYSAFIVAERLYTRNRHKALNGITKRFYNTIIVGEFVTQNFIPIGTPTKPENVELFASDKKITAYYDEPESLGGILSSNIRYHFYLNKISTGLLDNVSVVDTNNDTEIIIDKAFNDPSGGTARANAVALVNTNNYYFNMRVIGTVGGNGVTDTTRNLYDPFGTYNAILTNVGIVVGTAEVYVKYELTASNIVDEKEIVGDGLPTNLSVIPNEGVAKPVDVVVNPQDGKLVVNLNKNTSINDLLITVDYNDAQTAALENILAFDTRVLRSISTGTGGLISLDNYVSNNTNNIPDDVKVDKADLLADLAENKFVFAKLAGSPEKYSITISNLVNGKLYNISVRHCNFSGPNDFFSEEVLVVRAPEAPPTVVTVPDFSVSNTQISVSWGAPSNTGGAGVANTGNSDIKYRVLLYNVNGTVNTLQETQNTTATSFIFTGLTNGSFYRILVAGYYIKSDQSEVIGPYLDINSGDNVEPQNIANAKSIKPNPTPTGLTFTPSTTNLNNAIRGTITLPSSTQLTFYPLSKLEVIVRHKNDTTKSYKVQEIVHNSTYGGTTVNLTTGGASIILDPILDFTGAPAQFVHAKPLNGFEYEIIIRSVRDYDYAQAPPDVIASVIPYGPLLITNVAQKGLASAKTFTVTVNRNGTGSITNIVGLGKGANANLFGVANLSSAGANLPTITVSGTLDNATNYVASGQISTFDLNLSSVLSTALTISDVLAVVSSALGSDAFVFPTSGDKFFV
jgi:hypothetical protein